MKIVYEGKTKNVYETGKGFLLFFKNTVTGTDGQVDPGSNEVMGEVEEKGEASLSLSKYFFEKLQSQGFPTHYIEADIQKNTMLVKKAQPFGQGLEFICRLKAYGSFLKRYGAYINKLDSLHYLIEITLKDDARGDPLINEEAIAALGLMNSKEIESTKKMTKNVAKIIKEELSWKHLDLIDLKLEYGKINNDIAIIDEISGDNMRVMDEKGNILLQKDLARALLP